MLWQWTQLMFLQYKGLCQCLCFHFCLLFSPWVRGSGEPPSHVTKRTSSPAASGLLSQPAVEMGHHCGLGTGYCSKGLCVPLGGLGSLSSEMLSWGLRGHRQPCGTWEVAGQTAGTAGLQNRSGFQNWGAVGSGSMGSPERG